MANFSGEGALDAPSFVIAPSVIQWRVRWTCSSGRLVIASVPPPRKGGPLLDAACPGAAEVFSIAPGDIRLKIDASGPWTATVQQQVDTALVEPPLVGMESAAVLGAGDFYRVERAGSGTARLFDLPDGRRALRLDPFEVSQNTELYVWLSEADEPRTSADVMAVPHMEIALLKSTLGSQNYVLPETLTISHVGSVVIWCAPVRIVYAAASLAPP